MEVTTKERPSRASKTKQLNITSSFGYEVYEVGKLVECKFEVTKDGKMNQVWWEGLVMKVS